MQKADEDEACKPAPKPPIPSSPSERSSSGSLTTQSFGIKKNKKTQKFGCKLCDCICDSIKELTKHHQQTHNILYCETCSKAFNNPALLARHQYLHKDLKHKCDDCDKSFAFESTLQTHQISHRTLATHCCVYPKCDKKFKNREDLTWHVKEHDGILHECLDCDYENPDI